MSMSALVLSAVTRPLTAVQNPSRCRSCSRAARVAAVADNNASPAGAAAPSQQPSSALPRSPPSSSADPPSPSPFSSPSADPASPAGFTTRLEHMDTLTLHNEPGGDMHKWSDLDLAESELGTYCSRLSAEQETEKCWQAYSFLEQRREAATDSCDWERPESCEDLQHLNDMAHQLLSTGSMDDLVATFSTLARVEELRAMRAAKQAEHAQQAGQQGAGAGDEAPLPDPIHDLFVRMDSNGDGRLSLAKFRQGMAMLGDELDDATVALISDAMDLHGFLSEQQFRDIVEAEAINSRSMLTKLWRHHTHF